MKIRNGFVSNSSSSSFLIYGIYTTIDDIKAKIKTANDSNDNYAFVEDILDKYPDLDWYEPYDDGGIYIGVSWSSIKDDETGKEFKLRINERIEKIFGKQISCGTYSEAWRDG